MIPDLLVIGGGVVGLTAALEMKRRHPDASVTLLEKERAVGQHASGRNSGVLHAGFYYGADSLKARFTVEGNRRMSAFCEANGLPLLRCGKLVVARSEAEHPALDALLARARANRVDLRPVTEAEARAIEPRARTAGRALWSPTTSVVDPAAVMARLGVEARTAGVRVETGAAWTPDRRAGFVLNAAGLQADRVARAFGFARHHRILPFKGLYLYGDVPPGWLRTLVYPVPDLEVPFLGVHFTVTADGGAKIGPTALPAPWREAYGWGRFSAPELVDVLAREARMFLLDPSFRRTALRELPKVSRRVLARQASKLVRGVEPAQWKRWGKPGIRAQIVDTRTGRMEMDFVVEGDARSLHVLNAVSPAFTCAWAMAEWLVGRVEGRVGGVRR